jgi:hypothetical protein
MKRYNAFTIEVTDWGNSDLWQLLSETLGEDCLFDQPDLKKDGVFWLEEVPKELFKYSKCFNWLSGSAKLWLDNEPVTRFNYRMPIFKCEEFNGYDILDYKLMTDIAPITEEI